MDCGLQHMEYCVKRRKESSCKQQWELSEVVYDPLYNSACLKVVRMREFWNP